jgi:hypothetical protein
VSEPDEFCPKSKDEVGQHCECWGECEPCCWCGDDTRDPLCDCPKCCEAFGRQDPLSPDGEELVQWTDYFPKGIKHCDLCDRTDPHGHTQQEYGTYELLLDC